MVANRVSDDGRTIEPTVTVDDWFVSTEEGSIIPVLALDQGSAAFAGRVYVAWVDIRRGWARVWHSSDGGRSWARPRLVDDAPAPGDAQQAPRCDPERAKLFADEMETELSISVARVSDLESAVRASDICVTCTSAMQFFLHKDYVSSGTFIAAVGAHRPSIRGVHPIRRSSSSIQPGLLCSTLLPQPLSMKKQLAKTRARTSTSLNEDTKFAVGRVLSCQLI
jgi:Ornithine cyclodeaminase/mu-crystallin family